jgi:hypothetical protein
VWLARNPGSAHHLGQKRRLGALDECITPLLEYCKQNMARSQQRRMGPARNRHAGRRLTPKLGFARNSTQPSRGVRDAAAEACPNVVAMRVG